MEHHASHLRLSLPEATAPEIAIALAALAECRRRTKVAVAGLPLIALDSRPNVEAALARHSISTLLYHIAATEVEWSGDLLEMAALPSDVAALIPHGVRSEAGELVEVQGESVTTHLNRLEVARAHLVGLVTPMSLAEFRRPRQTPSYTVTPEWVLYHLMQHEAEHRGQIAQLKRAVS